MIELLLMLAQGPISKWDDREPSHEYMTTAQLFDIERCLVDLPDMQAPSVYRQPDRPDETNILWSDQYGMTGIRIRLQKTAERVRVTAWKAKRVDVEACAPPIGE